MKKFILSILISFVFLGSALAQPQGGSSGAAVANTTVAPTTCTAGVSKPVVYLGTMYQCSAGTYYAVPTTAAGGSITGLTATRVPVAASATTLTDYAGFTHDGTTLTVGSVAMTGDSFLGSGGGSNSLNLSGRGFIGYNSTLASVIVQGGASKGLVFAVNSGTFGTVATEGIRISSGGLVGINLATTPGAQLQLVPSSSSTIGQIIKLAASQSADAFQVQNSSGTVLSSITKDGYLNVLVNGSPSAAAVAINAANTGFYYLSGPVYSGIATVVSGVSTGFGFTASGSVNLQSLTLLRWSIDGAVFSTADMGLARNAAGILEINNGTAGQYRDLRTRAQGIGIAPATGTYALGVTPSATTEIGIVVKGAVSQASNLQEWQNSAGTALTYIQADGNIRNVGGGTIQSFANFTNGNSPIDIKGTPLTFTVWNGSAYVVGATLTGGSLFGVGVSPTSTIHASRAGEALFTLNNSSASSNGNWTMGIGSGGQHGHGIFFIDVASSPSVADQAMSLTNTATTTTFIVGKSADTTSQWKTASSSATLQIVNNLAAATTGTAVGINLDNGGPGTYTSGDRVLFDLLTAFSPTSGTGTLEVLNVRATINQTGGASGITRGIYVNPTLTAAADWRAIETASGKVIFNAGVATTVPLTLKGAASQSANLQEWQSSAAAILASVTAEGYGGFGITGSSTYGLTVQGVAATGSIAQFRSGYGSGGYIPLYDSYNSVTRGYIGYGPALFTSAVIGDFGIRTAGGIVLGLSGAIGAYLDGSGRLRVRSGGAFAFVSDATDANQTIDAVIERGGAGIVTVGTTAGSGAAGQLYTGTIGVGTIGGNGIWQSSGTQFDVRSDFAIRFSSSTTVSAAKDVSISRISAGVIGVGTGAAASVAGSMSMTNLTLAGNFFAGPSTIETFTTNGTALGTLNYYTDSQTIYYDTAAATGDVTLNVDASASVDLNTRLATGQMVTVVLAITNTGTPYKCNTLQVHSVGQTIKWVGGAAPTGTANAVDFYTFTIMKTGASTYYVTGSKTAYY